VSFENDWPPESSDLDGELLAVTFADGLYVAVGARGEPPIGEPSTGWVVPSDDGQRWTERYVEPTGLLWDVAAGGGRFVAVGWDIWDSPDGFQRTASVLTSEDGSVWVAQSAPAELTAIAWGQDRFVAVAGGDEAFVSTTGESWSSIALPQGTNASGIVWGPPGFVATGAPNRLAFSTDGESWQPAFASRWLNHIDWLGDRYVASGQSTADEGAFTSGARLESTDGMAWYLIEVVDEAHYVRAFAADGVIVVGAAVHRVVADLGDGAGFTDVFDSPDQLILNDVAAGAGGFVLVGQRRLRFSADARDWSASGL
jgi:hypothetical protein